MRRYWLIFTQAVTIALAVFFVLITLKPFWFAQSLPAPASGSLTDAAKKATPAVVSITVLNQAPRAAAGAQGPKSPDATQDPWFRFFFGEPEPSEPQAGMGSGVIIDAQGYLLTNNHVVEQAQKIMVQLADGRKASAEVVGTDPDTDLALLKIKLDKLPVIVWGNSDKLQVGESVLAIGYPFGVGQTVTSGIVSALGRSQLGINTFENFIQTDAAINPGNSGGALVGTQGQLLGINSAIYSRSGGSLGIGFAIPVSTAKQVMDGLLKDGQITRGWIGVEPQELNPAIAEAFGIESREGVIIMGVLPSGPAAKAGIRPGDVVQTIAGQTIADVPQLLRVVAGLKPDSLTSIEVLRAKKSLKVSLKVGKRPTPKSVR